MSAIIKKPSLPAKSGYVETENYNGERVYIRAPTEQELLIFQALADIDAAREEDKLNTQLAIAELAEVLLGGE